MRARRLTGPEELDAIGADIPWLAWGVNLRRTDHIWLDADGPAVAVVRSRRAYGTSLAIVGDPAAAVDLAESVAPGLDVTSVTLPRGSVVQPGHLFGPAPAGVDWDWMWTTAAPPSVEGEARIGELDLSTPAAREELAAFLARHSPRHSAEPDDDHARAWLGVRCPDHGELLACVALYEAVPGVDLMASVAVAESARGQGLGLAISAAATRRSLRERPPVATVDLYADNDAARALYAKLGYRLDQQFISYALTP